jgi:uncharacterized protein YbjT (DUF2867 family)
MKVLLFGATGMVGQGVLRECLQDPGVEQVAALGRSATGVQHPKLVDIRHADLANYAGIEDRLHGFDACFFTLGVSSAGMKEADYDRVTYGFTLAAGETLGRLNPGMAFIYVSGAGTDSTERGRTMWARVKGCTENALLRLPLNAYMFRPGFIQPLDGIQSKTQLYRVLYKIVGPLGPLLRRAFPSLILTTREIGQAMIAVARQGYEKHILEVKDIRRVVESAAR